MNLARLKRNLKFRYASASGATRPCFWPRGSMATMSGASCADGEALEFREVIVYLIGQAMMYGPDSGCKN
jgi:hypothetical protein